jgi:hypothetical protein
MILISITYAQSTWKQDKRYSEVKRASARVMGGWVTDQKFIHEYLI